MIRLTDNLEINKPAPVDDRLGVFVSTASALSYIPEDRRYVGLTVIVDDGNGAVEYWFKDGVLDGDLEVKSTGGGGATWGSITGTLSSQTDLQNVFDSKFDNPTGTTAQYLDGLGTPTDFPTAGQAGTLVRQVRNETGATLTKGTAVYISGASGNKALVSKAIATSDATSAQTFGIIQADIPTNQNGYVVVRGDLAGLDTTAYTEGAQLYLSSSTAGALTMTKQYAPSHLVYMAIVTRVHANQGSIEVAIQNGYEMDELHNVSAQTPSNRDGLFWNSSTNLWEARATAEADLPSLSASKITSGTFAKARIPKVIPAVAIAGSAVTAGNTTSEVVLQTLTIPANTLSVGDVIRIGGLFTYTTTGTKSPRVRFGTTISGNALLSPPVLGSTVTSSQIDLLAVVTSSTNLRFATNSIANTAIYGANTGALVNQTIDLTQTISFVFTIQKTTGTDTATNETAFIEIITS